MGDRLANDLEDREHLLLLKKGDYPAFDMLYTKYSARLLGRLIRLLGSESLAEELLQELFFRVWEKRAQIDIDQSFKSYLFTIAQNMVYDFFRKQSVAERYRIDFLNSYSELYDHVEEKIILKQTEELLMQSINNLPLKCRTVYILFKLEGKSYSEISDLLGISKSTINNHLVKANSILKKDFPHLFFWLGFSLSYILN